MTVKKTSPLSIAAILLLSVFTILYSCKKDDKLDCSTLTGATFSTNAGKMQAILANKCALPACHGVGGAGSANWTYSTDYNSIIPHFDGMYESVFVNKTMPKTGATPLTQSELDAFQCWKDSGFPE